MPSYTLEPRQQRFYTDVVDLYRPVQQGKDPVTKRNQGMAYELAYSDVPCRMQPKPEDSKQRGFGRVNHDIIVTTDILRVHLDQELDDTWAVHFKTPSHPEAGMWMKIIGGTLTYQWRAKSRQVYLKRGITPPEVI